MPGTLIERPKMTRSTYMALKQYIIRQREKKKEEEREQESVKERVRKEKELKRKREEEHNSSLEQVSKQLIDLKKKLDGLQKRKSEVFGELRKVLQQDAPKSDKDDDVMRQLGHLQKTGLPMPAHPVFVPGATAPVTGTSNTPTRSSMFGASRRPHQSSILSGMSSRKSPSPPPPQPTSTPYMSYKSNPAEQYKESGVGRQGPPPAGGKMSSTYKSGASQQHSIHSSRSVPYPQPPRKTGYGYGLPVSAGSAPPAGVPHSATGAAKAGGGAAQSAFTSYPSHYAQHRKVEPGYPTQQQQGRHVSGASSDYALSGYKSEPRAGGRPDDKVKQPALSASMIGGGVPPVRVGHPPQALATASVGYPNPHGGQHGVQHASAYPPQQQATLRGVRPSTTQQQPPYSLPDGRLYRGPHPPSSGYY